MRKLFSYLFLLVIVNGCHTVYKITEKKSGYQEIKNESEDETINKMIQPYRDSIAEQMETVIGKSEMEMKTGQPESLLGNFICDLTLQYNPGYSHDNIVLRKPTFVLMNYRGLRAPLPKGDIKIKNIYEIMPFENTLVYVDMKGSTMLEMTKFLIGYGGQPVSANYRLTVEPDKSFSVTIDGNPIDTNAIYTVITTDYLANGGDNMSFFSKAVSKNETNYKLRDLILDQIKANTKNGIKNTAATDGRISFK